MSQSKNSELDKSILKLLKDRYFVKDESSWEQLSHRVGSLYPEIEKDIRDMKFIPSSPTLMNCNTSDRVGTLSSCFPMKMEDSIEGIFESLKECSIVTKYAGGIGIDYSTLRSSHESVKGIGGRNSSGPIPFIKIFDSMLDGVQQGGARRGAGMALLDINHPDILEFIQVKDDLTTINRMNLSIKIPTSFYRKLEKTPDAPHTLNYKDGSKRDLVDSNGNTITVQQLWDIIIAHSHRMAEPGIFNSSIAYDRCTVTNVDTNVICNPCSEFTSIPYSSCNLGSINLSELYNSTTMEFDWLEFEKLIVKSVRFLNKVIDNNIFPIPNIEKVTHKIRPIGLGIMGLADLFFKLKLPYNSKRAAILTKDIFKYLTLRSMKESVELAKTDTAYPSFDLPLFLKANERFFTESSFRGIDISKLVDDIKTYGIRNSGVTSIAPTGTIATIANTSGGIEPVFALSYTRKVEKLNKEYDLMYITDPIFDQYITNNFDDAKRKEIVKFISDNKGSCQKCDDIPEDMKKVFVTAGDLTPHEHLEILGRCAENVTYSVSKTINLPSDATQEEVSKVFLDAHKKGIIGVTVYRDGCREGVLVHNPKPKASLKNGEKFELPDVMKAKRINMSTPKGKASLFVVLDDNKVPIEFYVNPPVESPEQAAVMTAICRLIAVGIQGFKDIDEYLDQLKKASKMYENKSMVLTYVIKSLKAGKTKSKGIEILKDLPVEDEDEVIVQCLYTIMKSAQEGLTDLTEYIQILKDVNHQYGNISTILVFLIKAFNKFLEVLYAEDGKVALTKEVCPDCGIKMILEGGCAVCKNCLHSRCG